MAMRVVFSHFEMQSPKTEDIKSILIFGEKKISHDNMYYCRTI